MMKIYKKIILLMLAFFVVCTFCYTTKAISLDPEKYNPNPSIEGQGKFLRIGNSVLGWIQTIGILIAVVVLSFIGLKYMFSSVEGKAEFKKTMIPYVIGCFVLGGISIIIEIIGYLARF